ncbi:hypothetical protein [Qipengyuania sp.]|uniref:hypothetical protein n=1 Tax=Qipengyuania sp. TaxID=2004515 RepID=UPI003736361B
MDWALLRALILLPFWLFLTYMILGFLGGGVADFAGLKSKNAAYAITLLFFLAYFPVAIWIYRRKGSDLK